MYDLHPGHPVRRTPYR